NALENFFHAISEPVGLGHALDLRFAVARAQNGGELAEPVKALVVHLAGGDSLETGEDFLQPVRQRMNVAQMDRADLFAVLARHFHRIVDRSVSRTPTDEESVAFLVAVNFWHRNFFGELAP